MDFTKSDLIALGALAISGFTLLYTIFKDSVTGREQKIEDSIDRHIQSKMSDSHEKIADIVEQRFLQSQAASLAAVKPNVTARFSNGKVYFRNNGKSRAVAVEFEIVGSGGNSPFVGLDMPFNVESGGSRSFTCTQNSSALRMPFQINIRWTDDAGREYKNDGVTIAP